MTPDEALLEVMHQRPKSVLIISESENGELNLTTGPSTNIAAVNLLLDQAKQGVLRHTLRPTETPTVGFKEQGETVAVRG